MDLVVVITNEYSLERTSRTLEVLGMVLFYYKKTINATNFSTICHIYSALAADAIDDRTFSRPIPVSDE